MAGGKKEAPKATTAATPGYVTVQYKGKELLKGHWSGDWKPGESKELRSMAARGLCSERSDFTVVTQSTPAPAAGTEKGGGC